MQNKSTKLKSWYNRISDDEVLVPLDGVREKSGKLKEYKAVHRSWPCSWWKLGHLTQVMSFTLFSSVDWFLCNLFFTFQVHCLVQLIVSCGLIIYLCNFKLVCERYNTFSFYSLFIIFQNFYFFGTFQVHERC